jgi:hypothetical protein
MPIINDRTDKFQVTLDDGKVFEFPSRLKFEEERTNATGQQVKVDQNSYLIHCLAQKVQIQDDLTDLQKRLQGAELENGTLKTQVSTLQEQLRANSITPLV